MPRFAHTVLLVFSGLFGALGVAGAAAASHGGDNRLVAIAAAIAFVHAPALIALAAVPDALMRLRTTAGLLMIMGTLLFSGDLAARSFLGARLFANAAPTGGMILIAAWLAVVAGAIWAVASAGRTPGRPE